MNNKRTCLYDKHVALGALISPFGGFDMPIQYSNITDEHQAVRQHCGVFDVSHMGEVLVSGTDAERYVNHIFTNNVEGLAVGKILYGMMCYENGGVVDDLLVYKMADDRFFLVINAANIDKDWAWIQLQAEGFNVILDNQSDYYGQLAVQGPEAERIMEEILNLPCSELTFYTFKTMGDVIVSRTGYTGEDGFEIYATPDYINQCWDKLMAAGVTPCGLGCRDTLRFEVGLPLYGDELSAEITPIMAGLGMFVKLDKEEFVGRDALAKQKAEGVAQKRGYRTPRQSDSPSWLYRDERRTAHRYCDDRIPYHLYRQERMYGTYRQPVCATRHRTGSADSQKGVPWNRGQEVLLRQALQKMRKYIQ